MNTFEKKTCFFNVPRKRDSPHLYVFNCKSLAHMNACTLLEYSQVERHRFLIPTCKGSNPFTPKTARHTYSEGCVSYEPFEAFEEETHDIRHAKNTWRIHKNTQRLCFEQTCFQGFNLRKRLFPFQRSSSEVKDFCCIAKITLLLLCTYFYK